MINPVNDIDTYITPNCDVEKGDIVVDIGAHVGEFIHYAQSKNAGRIIAFEPCDELFKICKLIKEVELTKAAVCLNNGKGNVYFDINDTPSSGIYLTRGVPEEVDFISFKSILNNLEKIDFLKIDCEGTEKDFLPELSDEELLKIRKWAVEWHAEISDRTIMEKFINRLENAIITFSDNSRVTFTAWRK